MAEPASEGEQLIVSRVGDRLIGMPVAAVVRVLPMLPLWRPPTTPAPLAGFVSVDGAVLAVLDGGALLGERSARPALYSHILMLTADGRERIGLMVDRAEGFGTPDARGAIDPTCSLNGCAVAIFQHRGAVAHLIAPDRLLDRADRETLAALTAEAARRRAEWQAVA